MTDVSIIQYGEAIKEINKNNYDNVLEIFNNITPSGIDNYILPILQAWAAANNNINPEGLQVIAQQAERGVLSPIYSYHVALINEYLGNDEAALFNYENIVKKAILLMLLYLLKQRYF